MKTGSIDDIIRPCTEELPPSPSVGFGERISRAIELMVSHNLGCIAVVRDRRVVGLVRLEDAFSRVGLRVPGQR